METLLLVRFVHVIGACVLLGTGIGIAFFMVMARRTNDPGTIAHTSSVVVVADAVFTATAVVVQPITGVVLAQMIGWPLTSPWIVASVVLYVVVGLFWLPVVWIQIRLRDLAREAAAAGTELPQTFDRLYRIWFACGIPAFLAVLVIVWLMLARTL